MNAGSHWGGAQDYERLRSHVLGGPVPEAPLLRTLDVFLHSGLALWMIFGCPQIHSSLALHPPCPLFCQDELVFLLAHMIEPQL